MAYDENSPSGAAPVRARSNEALDSASQYAPPPSPESSRMKDSGMQPLEPMHQNAQDIPLHPDAPQLRAGISDDLRVPWGWQEVALFVILLVIGSVVVTRGMAEVAVRLFGV